MTKREQRARDKIDRYRDLMNLRDWAINISFGRDDESNSGTCKPAHQYKEADLNFDLELHGSTRPLNETVRHELAHMVLAPLEALAVKFCQGDKVLMGIWEDTEDLVATHIARMTVWDSPNE